MPPVQTWSPGQVLTASELTAVTNMLPYPAAASANVSPCAAGTLYLCRPAGGSMNMTLPAPAIGTKIGFIYDDTTGTVTISRNTSELIYAPLVSGSRGVASMTLSRPNTMLELISDGTNWYVVSASPRMPEAAQVTTSQTTASTTYTDLATVGPTVTVTTLTTALVILSCVAGEVTASNVAYMGVAVSGASTIAATDVNAAEYAAYGAASASTTGGIALVTGLTPGANTFTAKYRTNAGTATFYNRTMAVIPLGV